MSIEFRESIFLKYSMTLFFGLAILPGSFTGQSAELEINPVVENGSIDLNSVFFNGSERVSLDGSWYYSPNRLLSKPGDFTSQEYRTERVLVREIAGLPESFFGTYTLHIRLPWRAKDWGIRFSQLNLNARIFFVDITHRKSTEIGSYGIVSKDAATELFYTKKLVVPFLNLLSRSSQDYLIVIQMSNHKTEAPWLGVKPYLGQIDAIRKETKNQDMEGFAIAAMLFLITVTNLMIFLRRPDDMPSLFASLFALCSLLRYLVSEGLWYYLLTDPPRFVPEFYFNFGQFFMNFLFLCFGGFLCYSFPRYFRSIHLKIIVGYLLLMMALDPFLNVAAKYITVFIGIPLAWHMALTFTGLYKAIRGGERGAGLAAVGISLLIFGILNDLAVYFEWSPLPYLNHYMLVLFALIQSSIVSNNFAHAFRTAERLTKDLAKEVEQQTWNAKTILRCIHQGIFTIDGKTMKIGEDYSSHLERILETDGIQNRTIEELILTHSDMSLDEKSMIESILASVLNEDEVNFDFNSENLPREIEYKGEHNTKALRLDWAPVVNQSKGVTEKVIVTVRDVTKLKTLEQKSADQERVMRIISEILDIPPDLFSNYLNTCRYLLDENIRLLEGASGPNMQVLKILFINMHTMKGGARSYGLKSLAETMHLSEQYYGELQISAEPWDQTKLKNQLMDVESIFKHYESTWIGKLGRSLDNDSVEIDMFTMRETIKAVQEISESPNTDPKLKPFISHLRQTFYGLYYHPANEVLPDLFGATERLARDLGKGKPDVTISCPELFLTHDGIEILNKVFVHILRNTMDHGIESSEERLEKGKSEYGALSLTVDHVGDSCRLTFKDDGRGLNLNQIEKIGLEKGLLSTNHKINDEKIADLIFSPGFSTSDTINEISGRGVGMGAVRQFLEDAGGGIGVDFLEPKKNGFRPFQFELDLPPGVFRFL